MATLGLVLLDTSVPMPPQRRADTLERMAHAPEVEAAASLHGDAGERLPTKQQRNQAIEALMQAAGSGLVAQQGGAGLISPQTRGGAGSRLWAAGP
jgi:hypothetical protein